MVASNGASSARARATAVGSGGAVTLLDPASQRSRP